MKRTRNVAWTLILLGIFAATGCRVDSDRMNSVKDGDGNRYAVRKIGTQEWLGSNLRTTRFNDGTEIPLITVPYPWSENTKPAYCWYNNDPGLDLTYGALYNLYVLDSAAAGGKNICPSGWHAATLEDWQTLAEYLGGMATAAKELKVEGELSKWLIDYNNKDPFRFSAYPGGYRTGGGKYEGDLMLSAWWAFTQSTPASGTAILMQSEHDDLAISASLSKKIGSYIRCIKD